MIINSATRVTDERLGEIWYVSVAFPVPLEGEVIKSHGAGDASETDHAQLELLVVILTAPVPPLLSKMVKWGDNVGTVAQN
jgi:hypothetical protein